MSATTYFLATLMDLEAPALVRGLRRRDPELLDRLIEQYRYRLFRYLLYLTGGKEAAEDVFQETWIRVLERGHQYNARWKFEAWLFSIARNLTIDLLRRKRTPLALDDVADSSDAKAAAEFRAHQGNSLLDRVASEEEGELVRAALGRLPASYREVLVLRFQEEMSLEEIASLVGAPLSTVKSRLYRGLEALREMLEERRP